MQAKFVDYCMFPDNRLTKLTAAEKRPWQGTATVICWSVARHPFT
jgi:hypothetical protein